MISHDSVRLSVEELVPLSLFVMKLVVAIRNGWIKPRKEFEIDEKPYFHLLWSDTPDDNKSSKDTLPHIPAPKLRLPGHRESYHPPPEYLPSSEEEEKWNGKSKRERKLGEFLPTQYASMLDIPAYPRSTRRDSRDSAYTNKQ